MKKLLIILSFATIILTGCEKEEKNICTKTVTIYIGGVEVESDTSMIVSLRGSYGFSETIFDENNNITLIVTRVDCECD